MSEKVQRAIDREYGQLSYILTKAFRGYRIQQEAIEITPLLHEAYLLLEDKSNYDKRWMKRRNAWLRRMQKLHPTWKEERIQYA